MVSFAEVPLVPCVPHDPADQSSVRGRDPVVLVDGQLCQRADIDLEFIFQRKGVAQTVVQAVDPLDHQDVVFSQSEEIPSVFSLSRLEIKDGKLHLFPSQKGEAYPG